MSTPNLKASLTKKHCKILTQAMDALNAIPRETVPLECALTEAAYVENNDSKRIVIMGICYIWDMDFNSAEILAKPVQEIDGVDFVVVTKVMREPGYCSDQTEEEIEEGLMTKNGATLGEIPTQCWTVEMHCRIDEDEQKKQ